MRVLGIDPGLAAIGFGVIESQADRWHAVEWGVIETHTGPATSERLAEIYTDLSALLDKHQPRAAAVEMFYPAPGMASTGTVQQAIGVIYAALGLRRIPVTPAPVSQWKAYLAHGKASKDEVRTAVQRELGLSCLPSPTHAADALAMALWLGGRMRVGGAA